MAKRWRLSPCLSRQFQLIPESGSSTPASSGDDSMTVETFVVVRDLCLTKSLLVVSRRNSKRK